MAIIKTYFMFYISTSYSDLPQGDTIVMLMAQVRGLALVTLGDSLGSCEDSLGSCELRDSLGSCELRDPLDSCEPRGLSLGAQEQRARI